MHRTLAAPHTMSYANAVRLGRTTPRLETPPLVEGPPGPCGCGCALSPDTSDGFDQVEYAASALERPALPWQRHALIHGGELLPDGRPRFRILLDIVARQNGKTEIPVVLAPYWLLVDEFRLVLGTSTKLEYAKDTWDKTRLLLKDNEPLRELMGSPRWYVRGNNLTDMWTADERGHYRIAAANEEGGRSLTIDRGVADELRQHHTYEAWNAMEPAASHEWSQIIALSNAGDDKSVVLNDLRGAAITFIEWTKATADWRRRLDEAPGDYRLGLLEWSAPEGADPEDEEALLQANPRVGYGRNLEDLLLEARRAKAKGGQALTGFKTEKMCIRVKHLNPAIDPQKWRDCYLPGTLSAVRTRVVMCVDVALDGGHATAVVAAKLPDGRIRVEAVAAWDSAYAMEQALPDLVATVRPRSIGWFPNGPAAAVASRLADRNKAGTARRPWPPRGMTVEAIRFELPAVCMGLEKEIGAGQVLHSGDPLLDDQVNGAERLDRPGGVWVFSRGELAPEDEDAAGHCDAVYAMAGAVHLARTLPAPVGPPRLVGPSSV